MADEPESQEVRDLLRRTATVPSAGLDVGAIRSRIRRRRRVRHGAAGLAAVVLLAGGAALAIDGDDGGTEVHVIEQPETTETTVAEPPGDEEPTELETLGALAPEGIAVQTDAGVELRALDGTLLHTLEGYELATQDREDGLVSTVTNVLPLRDPDSALRWFDPASGLATTVSAEGGAPLWNGAQAAYDPDRGVRPIVAVGLEQGWTATDEWRLSSDHQIATVLGAGYFDSATSGQRLLAGGCWIAARSGDHDVHVCKEGDVETVAHFVAGSGGAALVPEGTDGEPRSATAAWLVGDDLLVRTEQATCFVADAMVLRDDTLVPLLGLPEQGNPSSAPVGVALDGRAIVHLNAAACDATAAEPGVYLIDMETGERELVWAGSAQLWEVRAWTTLPLAERQDPPTEEPPPTGPASPLDALEAVAPEAMGRDLLLFGEAGIDRIVGGERRRVWDEPVDQAFDDGAGGTVFQEVPGGAILRAVTEPSVPVHEVVPAVDRPGLLAVLPFRTSETPAEPPHGRPYSHVWFTREDRHGSDDPVDWTRTLHRGYPLQGGEEQLIGDAGGFDSRLEDIGRVGDERVLFSTCHTQCAIRTALDDPDPVVLPHWLGGLDGSAERWAYVRFAEVSGDGLPTGPVLTVHDGADDIVSQVRLPTEISWETYVDLSQDGTAALVWSRDWQTGEVTGPVLVDGLDTEEPRVRRVDSDGQQVRFFLPAADPRFRSG